MEKIQLKRSGAFNVLSREQVLAVAREAESEAIAREAGGMFASAIIVAAYAGLRTGEVRALRWRDVDFAKGLIRVERNIPAGGNEGPPKGGRVRSVPLMDVQAYMGHADIQTTMRYAHHVPKHDAAARLTAFIQAEDESLTTTGSGHIRDTQYAQHA